MKLLGIELKGIYKFELFDDWFNVFDENGNQIYLEDNDGDWAKWEYDENGNEVYYENSTGLVIGKKLRKEDKK